VPGATALGAAPIRVAVASRGDPRDPGLQSGVPAAIVVGLEEAGCEVRAVSARAPLGAWRPETAYSRRMRTARSLSGTLRLARGRAPAGCVQHGCDFGLLTRVPVVVVDDQTVAQAVRDAEHWPWVTRADPRDLERFVAAQRAIYHRARACCAKTHWVARSMLDDYGVPPERVHVVGTGATHLAPARDRDWSRPVFLWIGSDWERKDGAGVVAAFAAVRERFPAAALHLVGRHPRLELPGVVEHGRLALDDPAARGELAGLLAAATCLVVPSHAEPAGIVYAEALAAGIPSIHGTAGGAGTIVGDAGIAVAPGDGRELREAMLALCDPERARGLGERARRRAPLFTWRAVSERLLRAVAPPGVALDGLAGFL
jgi:glycosyltransferase involved in cell wall biosynthesis